MKVANRCCSAIDWPLPSVLAQPSGSGRSPSCSRVTTNKSSIGAGSGAPLPEISDEDVSLTRRAYMALADWADDTVGVDATVLP